MEVRYKKLNDNARVPFTGSQNSAGYDLCSASEYEIHIEPHRTVKVGTGLSIEIPEGYFGGIFARSGLATKKGLRPANCVGVCDSDYRGEYIVALHNDSDKEAVVEPGERIAQLIIIPYAKAEFVEAQELSETERGNGGFGSTGKL